MTFRIALIICALTLNVTIVISDTAQTFVWARPTKSAIEIRWSLPEDQRLPENFSVYRKANGVGEFRAIRIVRRLRKQEYEQMLGTSSADSLFRLIKQCDNINQPDSMRRPILHDLHATSYVRKEYAVALGLTLVDTTASPDSSYQYSVKLGGHTLGFSASVTIGDRVIVSAPEELHAQPISFGTLLSWKVDGGSKLGVYGYRVFRKEKNDGDWKKALDQPIITLFINEKPPFPILFEDRTLRNNVTYQFKLTALSVFGDESGESEVVSVSPTEIEPLSAPILLSAKSDFDSVHVKWGIDNSSRLGGLNVMRGTEDNFADKRKINQSLLPLSLGNYSDRPTDLPFEFASYSLQGIGKAGEFSPPSSSQIILVPDVVAPSNTSYFLAQAFRREVMLQWKSSSSVDVWGYELSRSLSRDTNYSMRTPSVLADSSFADLLPEEAGRTAFWYRIRAVDLRGNRSVWSEPVSASIADIVPASAPSIKKIESDNDGIAISWDSPVQEDVLGYYINRFEDTSQSSVPITLNRIPLSNNNYRDTSAIAGVEYGYEIVTVDSAFNYSFPSSRVFGKMISNVFREIPVLKAVQRSNGEDEISWIVPKSGECFIAVEESDDGNKFNRRRELSRASLEKIVLQRTARTAKFIRIILINKIGAESAPSNVIEVQ